MGIHPLYSRILIATLAFAVGVLSVWEIEYRNLLDVPEPDSVSNQESALRINACGLGEPSGAFVGKRVILNALVYHVSWDNGVDSEDFIFVHPRNEEWCTGAYDPFIITELDLRDYHGPHSNLKSHLGSFEYEVDVSVIGTVQKVEARAHSLLKYGIKPEKIKIISPWREFTPKGAG